MDVGSVPEPNSTQFLNTVSVPDESTERPMKMGVPSSQKLSKSETSNWLNATRSVLPPSRCSRKEGVELVPKSNTRL